MDQKHRYHLKWAIEDFTTRRYNRYSKKCWPFKGIDPIGKVYNPSFIVSYKSVANCSEKEVFEFYLKFDGALPKNFRLVYISEISSIEDSIVYSDSETHYVEHDEILLFSVVIKDATLRVDRSIMKYSREHDFIDINLSFKMYFRDPPKRTITPGINVPRKRRCNLCSDFKNLFDSKEMADVTITVNDVSLLSHKLVLVTRSPVFKAMFDNDCLESNTKNIQITDVDASVFDNFLKYLYCREIGDQSYDMVRNLYVLADKYDVDGLKEDCRDILESELNESTVCQLLEMSHFFKDETLSEKAVEFVKQHFSAVSKASDWIKLCENYPKMASEVLRVVTLFHAE